jgi:hypothetical protein
MSNKVKLKDLFVGLQSQMIAQLNTNREFISHPGSKGDSLENVWIDWLRKYLPNRYCIDKAIIVDSKGNLSDQIDLVIYDQTYTPFVFTQNGIHYIPAEGVYAVFEVKPDLKGSIEVKKESISYIEYAGRKIESVRKLKRTSASIINAGKVVDPRPLTKIIGGILSSTNTQSEKTVKKHLKSLTGLKGIDMGCAVGFGSFYVDYDGEYNAEWKASYQKINSNISDYYNNRKINSDDSIIFSSADTALVSFFLQLMRYLQQSIGTIAAIDLGAYADSINFEIDDDV